MKNKSVLYSAIITLVIGFIIFYFMLPPLNITSPLFWMYLGLLVFIYMILSLVLSTNKYGKILYYSKVNYYIFISFLTSLGLIMIINMIFSPVFSSKMYSKRIKVDDTSTFTEDIERVDFNKLPLIDKESSQKLGDRVMGQMPELVSQFTVSNLYTQINYNNTIVRITPLEYNGLFKFLANYKDGVKGYITVNSVTGQSNLIKLNNGMKYMDSAIFNKDLNRKLRFEYPTLIFGEKAFEIDNDGNPYWVVQTLKYTGIGLKKEVSGVIVLDPISGNSQKYEINNIPTWIDHVYDANLIIEEVNNWGTYKNGFLNSIFGQKDVVLTTEGYNYMVMNDDVYLYTGITSVSNDESNLGFILSNLRTKETKYYKVPGAEEYSAMDSAMGKVQQMKYKSTFPLLINLNNKPTYLMSLKDDSGLVKMYAFVDVTDYQKVVVTDASLGILKAANNYIQNHNIIEEKSLITEKIIISNLTHANIDGTTYYYFISNDRKYRISVKVDELYIPFIKNNDEIEISYYDSNDVIEILKINR